MKITLRFLKKGTDLVFKQNYPRVFSEALKKTRGSCKLNEHWYSSLKHEPGTELELSIRTN